MLPAELSSGGLPLLTMGRDIPDGRMHLRNGRLDIDWTREASAPYFERVRTLSRDMARVLEGRYADNPLWYLRRVITVHPLGGAPMGRHPDEGVVDPYGNVFGHPGLHIADGSVMPGPTGPNPSFTIAALADRFADHMLESDPRAAEAALT
jgi:cholesterol oxidase